MKLENTSLQGVVIVTPDIYTDHRGYYMESYSARTLKQYGIEATFVQDNHLMTLKAGTIRGIHFQINPKAQGKLVRCTRGKVMDFVIDLRKDSPTFKRWVSIELSEENKKQLWIPEGCGHAFLTLTDNVEFQYKVTEFYEPQYDRSIRWNDPELAIDWGIDNPILSEKDANAPFLAESDVNF